MVDLKLYKSLIQNVSNDKFKNEYGRGTISYVSWERLQPYIEHAVGKNPDEIVVGLKIDETGIHVRFERKKK